MQKKKIFLQIIDIKLKKINITRSKRVIGKANVINALGEIHSETRL